MQRQSRRHSIFIGSILFSNLALAVAIGTVLAAGTTTEAVAASGAAVIKGAVSLEGSAPSMKKMKMSADPVCLQQHKEAVHEETVVVNNGKLQNVVVYVKEGVSGNFPAPQEPVVLNQEGCIYKPHVFVIQAGQPLEIVNNDPSLHNINCQPKNNKRFNIAQPVKGMKSKKSFKNAEIGIPFKCNVHPWMKAYAAVLNHPFHGVTSSDGAFSLNGLPAGTYTVEAWHEKYGTQTQSVSIADGETKEISFSFKAN